MAIEVTCPNIRDMDLETMYKHLNLRHDDTIRPVTWEGSGEQAERAFHDYWHRTRPGDFDHDHEEMS
jgi:hypothetical protein